MLKNSWNAIKNGPMIGKIFLVILLLGGINALIHAFDDKPAPTMTSSATPAHHPIIGQPGLPSHVGDAELLVSENAQVAVYVKLVDSGERRYNVRILVKKPGSPLVAPMVRAWGSNKIHSAFVDGVDNDDMGFCFGPPHVVDLNMNDHNLDDGRPYLSLISRRMNGMDALGKAYHELVLKYERKRLKGQ
jgi:hypothetical protein